MLKEVAESIRQIHPAPHTKFTLVQRNDYLPSEFKLEIEKDLFDTQVLQKKYLTGNLKW